MRLRVYVAADYARKAEVSAICSAMRANGIETTSTWADAPAAVEGGIGATAQAELGAALALGKPVLVFGPREHVFHWHPLVQRVYDSRLHPASPADVADAVRRWAGA